MNAQPRGLGRGLNALFEDEENTRFDELEAKKTLGSGRTVLGVDQMEPGRFQPRKIFDAATIDELADSIKQHGILQPLLVRKNPNNPARYEIIAGERRWRAAQKARLHEVPVIIREMSDQDALEIALIENLQREDLNPVDEAMSYKRLMEDHDYTQEKLAQTLGKSRPYIANMVRLLSLSDVVLGYLERGDLSTGHARALITSDNQDALARQIVEQKLSVRETEKLVSGGGQTDAQTAQTTAKSTSSSSYTKDTDTLALENDLSNHLGMRVQIKSKNGKSGTLMIDFKTLDQLDNLLKKLS